VENLSRGDKQSLLDFIHSAVYCNTQDELNNLIHDLKGIIPFDYATCVISQYSHLTNKVSQEVININYPTEWLELYIAKNFKYVDPIIIENFKHYKLQYWEDTYKKYPPPKNFLKIAASFGLIKGYTHGARSANGKDASLTSIAGPAVERNERTESIFKVIVPHFHQTLIRVSKTIPFKDKIFLSPREQEVLKWVAHGKSSWDISVILGISERTINFHVNSIMQKLDAVTRAHAVAIAFDLGLICID